VPAVAVGAPAQLPLAGVRVLLVPEERMAGQLMATALARAGADVDLCDPAQAVNNARAARPDVLVSGQMGFGDPTRGLLAQVRRDAGLGLRAVAVVNASRPAERARARREGYDAELTRPVDSVDLIGVVLRVLGRQQR
jgi:DNA-binding response OmpR family regulator